MLEFECPHCRELLFIPEQFLGASGSCRKCGGAITIEQTAAHNPDEEEVPYTEHAPTLVAFHCETTGPSSRKCNIIELGAIKFDLHGRETDSYWSFASPGHLIPPRISEKTGITDEMLEGSPSSQDVVKGWSEWLGPHALLFSHHAHFDTKFVCSTLLKEDIDPPHARVIDVLKWARELEVPVSEYRLRPLLDHIGYPVTKAHRSLDTCHGVAALAVYLAKRCAGAHVEVEHGEGMLGRFVGKRVEAVNEEVAHKEFQRISKSLEAACGDGFFDKIRYDTRVTKVRGTGPAAGAPTAGPNGPSGTKRPPGWFDERRRRIESFRMKMAGGEAVAEPEAATGTGPWDYLILEASQTDEREEQRRLCLEAVNLGAKDPWPYDRLVHLLIKAKLYDQARDVCEKYFETDNWLVPKWAETSLKLLRKLEKLDRKLATKGDSNDL